MAGTPSARNGALTEGWWRTSERSVSALIGWHAHAMPRTPRDPRTPIRWALAAFVVTAVVTRTITLALHLRGAGENGGLMIGGTHIHHMVFGLIILAIVTVIWLVRQGAANPNPLPALEPILFGIAWALILDESALIINLSDVYWTAFGEAESLVALALFAGVLSWFAFRPVSSQRK